MKAHILVLIDCSTQDISASLHASLNQHELDWDDDVSIENRHWDYWVFALDGQALDATLAKDFPNDDASVLANAAYVGNLPDDFTTTGVICLDGSWIDVDDFGWRMLNEPSNANNDALDQWQQRLRQVLEDNRQHIGVQVIVHS